MLKTTGRMEATFVHQTSFMEGQKEPSTLMESGRSLSTCQMTSMLMDMEKVMKSILKPKGLSSACKSVQ